MSQDINPRIKRLEDEINKLENKTKHDENGLFKQTYLVRTPTNAILKRQIQKSRDYLTINTQGPSRILPTIRNYASTFDNSFSIQSSDKQINNNDSKDGSILKNKNKIEERDTSSEEKFFDAPGDLSSSSLEFSSSEDNLSDISDYCDTNKKYMKTKKHNINKFDLMVSTDKLEKISKTLSDCCKRKLLIKAGKQKRDKNDTIKYKPRRINAICETILEEHSSSLDDDNTRKINETKTDKTLDVCLKAQRAHVSKLPKYIGNRIKSDNKGDTIVTTSSERCHQLSKELAKEREIRSKTEHFINKLRRAIEINRDELNKMERSKATACELAYALQIKYDKVNKAQQDTLAQLEVLKRENSILSKKLDVEFENREQIISEMKSQSMEQIKERTLICKNLAEKRQKSLEADYSDKIKNDKETNERLIKDRDRLTKQLKFIQTQAAEAKEECKRLNLELKKTKEAASTSTTERYTLRKQLLELELKVTKLLKQEEFLKDATNKFGTDYYDTLKLSIKLHKRCLQLEKQLKTYQEEDIRNIAIVEADLRKFTDTMKEKENLLRSEKEQLTKMVVELNDLVKVHKKRIQELLNLNKRQKVIIRVQKTQLDTKDQEIQNLTERNEAIEKESLIMREKVEELQKSDAIIENLKNDLNDKNNIIETNVAVIENLQKDLQNTKKQFESEKDTVLMKEKIIEDQCNTIKNYKEQLNGVTKDEMRKLVRNLAKMQQNLEDERDHKDQILKKLSKLSNENADLHNQIAMLEMEIEQNSSSHCYNKQKQEEILDDLEKKVAAKQKQWEIHRELLAKEKNEAVQAARYATKKLIETVIDFQNQVEAQKKVQKTLTLLLSEKETQLKLASEQVRKLMRAIEVKECNEKITRKGLEKKIKEAYTACRSVITQMKDGFSMEDN